MQKPKELPDRSTGNPEKAKFMYIHTFIIIVTVCHIHVHLLCGPTCGSTLQLIEALYTVSCWLHGSPEFAEVLSRRHSSDCKI